MTFAYLAIPSHHSPSFQTSTVTITPSPSVYISPWTTPISEWKIYKTSKFSFRYPPSMQVYVSNQEPNTLTGKFDVLSVDISKDGDIGLLFRIEPTYQAMTANDWALAQRMRTSANKQFQVPIEPYTFNGISAATQTLTWGMLLGTELYYPLGNNMIWVDLGGIFRESDKTERLKHLREIDLRIN